MLLDSYLKGLAVGLETAGEATPFIFIVVIVILITLKALY